MRISSPLARALALGCVAAVVAACGGGAQGVATAPGFGACEITDSPAIAAITTVSPDVLTLAGPLPFPVAYTKDAEGRLDGGYLYCLGAEVAHRAGLRGLAFMAASFPAVVSGEASGYDIALVDATVTPERAKVVSFAAPYGSNTSGVLARKASTVTQGSMGGARVGVVHGSLQQSTLASGLPRATIVGYSSPEDVAAAVASGDVDAGVLDTVLALVQASASEGALRVVAEFDVGGDLAPVLPRASSNTPSVSAIIESMWGDGTLDAIRARWLREATGADSDLPRWELVGP